MGATAFRPRVSSRGQYKARRARRYSGKDAASRRHETPPWYTFRIPGPHNPHNVVEDPIRRMEMDLAKFGERARYKDRVRAEELS